MNENLPRLQLQFSRPIYLYLINKLTFKALVSHEHLEIRQTRAESRLLTARSKHDRTLSSHILAFFDHSRVIDQSRINSLVSPRRCGTGRNVHSLRSERTARSVTDIKPMYENRAQRARFLPCQPPGFGGARVPRYISNLLDLLKPIAENFISQPRHLLPQRKKDPSPPLPPSLPRYSRSEVSLL